MWWVNLPLIWVQRGLIWKTFDLHAKILLLCFLLSAVSWLYESRLFPRFLSPLDGCVISSTSGSGLGVSGSTIWKLQLAEAEQHIRLQLSVFTTSCFALLCNDSREQILSSWCSSELCLQCSSKLLCQCKDRDTHRHLFSVVAFVGELVRSCSRLSSSSKGSRFTISTRWGSVPKSRITTFWLSHS